MTDWKGHIIIGAPLTFVFGLLLVWFMNIEPSLKFLLLLISLSVILSLVLDLDHPTSKLTSWSMTTFLGIGLVGIILETQHLILIGLAFTALIHFMSTISRHRGIIHSILFCVLFGLIIFLSTTQFFSIKYGTFFGLLSAFGAYTHLIGDKLYTKII